MPWRRYSDNRWQGSKSQCFRQWGSRVLQARFCNKRHLGILQGSERLGIELQFQDWMDTTDWSEDGQS